MIDCVFCKINKEEIPSYTIYEDDKIRCFLDVNPYSPGHTLIIPKKHYTNLEDIDEEIIKHIVTTSKKIYKLLDEKLKPDGIKIVQNNGIIQEVKHYHMHLIPIYKNKKEIEIKEIYNILTKK